MSEHPDSKTIDALGGTVETAKMFNARPSAVSNWRNRGIPARFHYAMAQLCSDRGIDWSPPVSVTPSRDQ